MSTVSDTRSVVLLQGRLFYDNSLPELTPQERKELYVAMTTTLTQLHSVDWSGCGLGDYGNKGDYCSRQVTFLMR